MFKIKQKFSKWHTILQRYISCKRVATYCVISRSDITFSYLNELSVSKDTNYTDTNNKSYTCVVILVESINIEFNGNKLYKHQLDATITFY
jgi:hypothetical protein